MWRHLNFAMGVGGRRRRPWVVSWRPQIRPPAARSVAEWLYPGGPRPWRARNAWKCRLGREDREDRREDCRKKCEDREDRGVRKRGEGGSLFLRGVLTVLTCFTTVLTPVLTGPHGPHGPEEGPPLLLSTAPTAPRFSRRPPLRPPRSPRSPQGAPMAPISWLLSASPSVDGRPDPPPRPPPLQ